ncbi:Kv channel-interacting protein 2 (KChIP2) (A-type potassium channel modulatory protein 2) (Cardiac voltage-gated potassium channel modulatory subunit) (Potassium channel-interacting protein 2) [Durusdinium trenchii]|uniref:Kv channel-interacting protein 2 (KChIP2) (A-type potassium channel modulatory protein 2) (Cardiac voltage-gated potassium channel modulatory subunit) (Potassium channel-interacting protein 2) n=1 Tax=Durusdinium trenchii TaxID=1381693 RepID=A0ABP0M639_9DINO
MGGTVDRFWAQEGSAEVGHGSLKQLQGWSRQDLRCSFETFSSMGGHAVNSRQFGQIIRSSHFSESKAMFDYLLGPEHAERGLLDFWSVIGPMTVMSGQHYISRVTFLFSIYDMDGDGCLNLSEIVIAVRTVFRGLAHFCPKASVPDGRRLEQVAEEMFQRFDKNSSGFVTIEEMVNYAYRSEGLLRLCEPFPAHEKHIFEEPVRFHSKSSKASTKAVGMEPKRGKMRDPHQNPARTFHAGTTRQNYEKPWLQAASQDGLTKAHAWVAWISFRTLASKSHPHLVDGRDLANLIGRGRPRVFPLIYAAVEESKGVDRFERSDEFFASRIVMSVSQALLAKDTLERLQRRMATPEVESASPPGHLELVHFLGLLWPKASEGAIHCCLRWCQTFHAHQVLIQLLKEKRASLRQSRLYRGSVLLQAAEESQSGRRPVNLLDHLDQADLKILFDALDIDGNGKLSARELCLQGGLSAKEAQRLLRIWDQDIDGELTQTELAGVVQAVDSHLKQQVKGMFASPHPPAASATSTRTSFRRRRRSTAGLPPATASRGPPPPPALLTRRRGKR